MKVLSYYFLLEFGWERSREWTSEKGFPRLRARASDEFLAQNGYINYELFESVFVSDYRMRNPEYLDQKLAAIKSVLNGETENTFISNECVQLEIVGDQCRIIDMLGDSEGIEVWLSWNITTPEQFQYISTSEVYQIVNDWRDFLLEVGKKQFTDVPPGRI